MNTKYLIKISAILITAIGLLFLLNIIILQGGFLVNRLGVIPARARLAAGETHQTPPDLNIRVKNFFIKSASADFFRKGQKIEISCTVENTSGGPAKNFQSLIRIPGRDIVTENIKILKARDETTLKGSLLLESTGILYLACRADVAGALFESNEHDNYEIAALYILPI